jgi:chromate reductase, NAD(P)H dehydrogenase (quinone)
MKVLAFAASSSKNSINKKLVTYAVSLLDDIEYEILDLNDYALPLFSQDIEKDLGHPQLAQDFFNKITLSDALLISFAEHNGCYSAAYKNIFDWCSRIDTKVYQHKPAVFLSTSPGAGGGKHVLELAIKSAIHFDGMVQGSLAVSNFYDNFDTALLCVSNPTIKRDLINTVKQLKI